VVTAEEHCESVVGVYKRQLRKIFRVYHVPLCPPVSDGDLRIARTEVNLLNCIYIHDTILPNQERKCN
jgi:hypothetical protein